MKCFQSKCDHLVRITIWWISLETPNAHSIIKIHHLRQTVGLPGCKTCSVMIFMKFFPCPQRSWNQRLATKLQGLSKSEGSLQGKSKTKNNSQPDNPTENSFQKNMKQRTSAQLKLLNVSFTEITLGKKNKNKNYKTRSDISLLQH